MKNPTVALILSHAIPILLVATATRFAAAQSIEAPVRLVQPEPDTFPNLYTWTRGVNGYVLRHEDAAVLIGLGDASVLAALQQAGVETIQWLLLNDHQREGCYGAGKLDRSVAKVAAPKAEQAIFENPSGFRKWYPKLGDEFSVYGAGYARPHREEILLDRALEDGEVLRWNGFAIRCVSTPGHSPGGMSYVLDHNDRRYVFSGGIIHDGAKMTTCFDTEWDYGFGKGIESLMKSVETLIDLQPSVLLPDKGPVIKDPSKQLSSYHEKLTKFLPLYQRGYQVFDAPPNDRDPISTETAVPQINRVTEHLYKLSRKNNPGKNFAIIIADSGKGLVLDCGLFPEPDLDKMIVGMREHLGLKSIDAFWISHMHGDHFLLGPTLKEKYGAQAWTLDRIADICEHPRRYDYAALVQSYSDGCDGMKIDRRFGDGESVVWEGYKIQVDWMPGQTEFGCCLWLDIDGHRIAFTGDNLFGNPANEKETGHEAVVARNSAIFEEGYLYGSRYLMDLRPTIVMGSHSNVMPSPQAFLRRYHAWAQEIIRQYQDLLPESDYEYLFDPYWVSAYPYRVDMSELDEQEISITVRNFRNRIQRHRIALQLPPGIVAEPPVLEGLVERESRHSYRVKLKGDRSKMRRAVQIATFDITLDGVPHGELFDFIIGNDEDLVAP